MNSLLICGFIVVIAQWAQCEQPIGSNVDPVLTIDKGSIQGRSRVFRGVEVFEFLCIPYAEPPIGENRFKKPIPKSGWANVLPTREWGPYCIQFDSSVGQNQSEDCLCLNVFTTSLAVDDVQQGNNQHLRPVMFWIHGGSFRTGSANMNEAYDGTALAALDDVVVVSINYRLGVLGFLHYPEADVPGNMGLWDQNLALRWLQTNIIHFGGDPNRVTIFGESAGSISVSAHILSPQSEGLFINAIMQSGAHYNIRISESNEAAEAFLKVINCSSDDRRSCLASFNYSNHPEVYSLEFWIVDGTEFLPVSPEEIISSSGVGKKVNLLAGTVGYEGAFMLIIKDPITFNPANPMELNQDKVKGILNHLFGSSMVTYLTQKYDFNSTDSDQLRLELSRVVGDILITCPTYVFAYDGIKNNNLNNVYGYYQSQRPSRSLFPETGNSKWVPATHSDDILPVFGYPFMNAEHYSREDLILSSMMINIWTTFAKTGKPPSIGPYEWSNWTKRADQTISPFIMELNSEKLSGSNDQNVVTQCLDKWPFPLDHYYTLNMEPGKLSNLQA